MPKCDVCHNHCELKEGNLGLCKARGFFDGENRSFNYGKITSIALDPIEKKPLNLFYPGSYIVSVGSFGCNLRCPFCQNHEISYGFENEYENPVRYIAPDELSEIAYEYRNQGNIGVAFTYNEPLVGYEYVIDAAREVHKKGMKTVLVSNGCVSERVRNLVIPHIDAMNIDLKGFTDEFYSDFLGGSRELVMDFIAEAAKHCHMEVTTLIIPGHNDTEDEIKELASWIASLADGRGRREIALHISRYFPRFRLRDIPATPVDTVYRLAEVAGSRLEHVFSGNC